MDNMKRNSIDGIAPRRKKVVRKRIPVEPTKKTVKKITVDGVDPSTLPSRMPKKPFISSFWKRVLVTCTPVVLGLVASIVTINQFDSAQVRIQPHRDLVSIDSSIQLQKTAGLGELDFAVIAVTDNIELYGALGLLNTEFTDFINAEGDNLTGREQAHAPNYQFNLGVNYYLTEQWLVNLSIDGKDEFYFSDSHDQKSESVTLANASVSYMQSNWQIRVWARNLLDEDYTNRGFYFGNDPRDGYTAKGYQQYAEPMVIGATLDYQF